MEMGACAMTTAAKVHLWNTCVGAVSVGDGPVARFQYADEFLDRPH